MSTKLAISLGLITWVFVLPVLIVCLRLRVVSIKERTALAMQERPGGEPLDPTEKSREWQPPSGHMVLLPFELDDRYQRSRGMIHTSSVLH